MLSWVMQMPDRDSGDELSDRMKERFAKDDKQANDANHEKSGTDATETSDEKEAKDDKIDYRDEWKSRLFYLPQQIADRIADEKKRLDYQCEWTIKMERHYYPVVAARGIDEIEDMDPDEFTEAVENTVGR